MYIIILYMAMSIHMHQFLTEFQCFLYAFVVPVLSLHSAAVLRNYSIIAQLCNLVLFAHVTGMQLVRRVLQQWVLRVCAYHSSSQHQSDQKIDVSARTVQTLHKCTHCLVEATSVSAHYVLCGKH